MHLIISAAFHRMCFVASFQRQDYKHLTFPVKMYIDYVRVYQRSGVKEGVGCSPSHHPTADYIEQ